MLVGDANLLPRDTAQFLSVKFMRILIYHQWCHDIDVNGVNSVNGRVCLLVRLMLICCPEPCQVALRVLVSQVHVHPDLPAVSMVSMVSMVKPACWSA